MKRLLTCVLLIGRGSREDGAAACFGFLDFDIMIIGHWFGVMEFKIGIRRPGIFAYLHIYSI